MLVTTVSKFTTEWEFIKAKNTFFDVLGPMLFYSGTNAHYVTVRLLFFTIIVLDSFPDSWLTIYL